MPFGLAILDSGTVLVIDPRSPLPPGTVWAASALTPEGADMLRQIRRRLTAV
jgi:hypothetical protein